MKYVSLHTHSTFSTGDGYGTVATHVSRAKSLGMTHLALTEHGNVSSWVQLEKQCLAKEIEPIFGIEAYVGLPKVRKKTHMILLAMNSVGISNINRIVTQSYIQHHYSPTVYWQDLVKYNEGIIALSGCASSALSCILLGGKYFGDERMESSDGDIQRAIRGVRRFQQVFGDRYYLEVQRFPGLERTCLLNPVLAQISSATGVSLVATSDVHYPFPEQNEMQRILHAAHRGKDVETADADWEYDILLTYPLSDTEILNDLVDTGLTEYEARGAIASTWKIAERCSGTKLPKAEPPRFGVANPNEALKQLITDGWNYRVKQNSNIHLRPKDYKARIKHEYETICAREGFADYFLIVADLVVWAKSQGIAVGPGRGSAAGSLVCYLLRITEIDSMQFPMLFERFLDPTRTDPPDIDIDFEDARRDEVFTYAASKYGANRVANILTFTRYKGKSSLDAIARVYHIPKWKIDAIKGKLIDRAEGHPRFAKTLEDTYSTFPEIAELVSSTPELNYAPKLEGGISGYSVHAAGMVIAGGDETTELSDVVATYTREMTSGRIGSGIAYDKHDAPHINLLKIDALSLVTMGEIAHTLHLAGMTLEELYRIPLDDKKVLQAFAEGDVLGIFQFEGNTTRRILKAVKPTTFMHLADVNALSRPGADDKGYVRNKNSGTLPEFAHDIIRQHTTVWPNTYGVITYEEQILMILRDLGGFEPAELNRMRKIIHDKLGSSAFNEYFKRFIKGAAAHGLSTDTAQSVWDGMVSASGYAFNIGHSVPYAAIGYWQQWLKIYCTAEAFTSKLTRCADDVRRGKIIAETERHGITVSPPRLLESGHDWELTDDGMGRKTIVAGFESVPGIGYIMAQKIIDWRDSFDLDDFFPEWDDIKEIDGIGPAKVKAFKEIAEASDPFGIEKTQRILDSVRVHIRDGRLAGVPVPTHVSVDIPTDKELVSFIGIVRGRKYYDAVEQLQKKSKDDLSYEDGLAQLENPHQLKYVALTLEDEFGEPVKAWIWRNKYQRFEKDVHDIKLDRDVVVVQGKSSEFGGIGISVDKMVVLNPHG